MVNNETTLSNFETLSNWKVMKTPTVIKARNHTTNITPLMALLIPIMIFNFLVRYNLARVIKREGDTDQHTHQKNRMSTWSEKRLNRT